MKSKMSLFVVLALASVMTVSGYALASDPQEPAKEVVIEQVQGTAEEGAAQVQEEAAQMTEEAVQEEKAADAMVEEAKEQVMENAPQGDK